MDDRHNHRDLVSHKMINIRRAFRLKRICLRQTRIMYKVSRKRGHLNYTPPLFMQLWWSMVEDECSCAQMICSDPSFLASLRESRERAQREFNPRF